jgi:capsular exopolysaccharide synthesis family protein
VEGNGLPDVLHGTRRFDLVPGKPSYPPAQPADTPSGTALLRALRRRWLLAAVLGTIVAGLVGAGVWRFLPPAKQTAFAKLLIPAHADPGIVFEHPEAHIDFQTFQRRQVALIKSRKVLDAALQRPEIAPVWQDNVIDQLHPVEWLEKNLKVDFPEGPEIPRISLAHADAEVARVLVGAVVEAYFDEIVYEETNRRRKHLEQLKRYLQIQEERREGLAKRLRELGDKVGAVDPRNVAIRQEFAEQERHRVQTEFLNLQAELRKYESEERVLTAQEDRAEDAVTPERIDEIVEKDPIVVEHREAIAKEKRLLAAVRRQAVSPNDPAIARLEARVNAAEATLVALKKDLRGAAEQTLRSQQRRDSQAKLALLRAKIEYCRQFVMDLQGVLDHLKDVGVKLKEGGLNLDPIKEEFDRAKALTTKLADEIEKLTVELEAPPRVVKLQPAAVSHVAELPRRLGITGLSVLGSFGLVLLGIAYLEFRAHRVDSIDGVVSGLGMKLVGTLPASPRRLHRRLTGGHGPTASRWQTILTESIDCARTLLVHAARSSSMRVVMITSAVSGEGKTSLATHLATSLARAGYKTLLIDCDLRNPVVHRLFDVPMVPGFSELLRGEVDVAGAVQTMAAGSLHLITAGQCDARALQMLAGGTIGSLLAQLKTEYEFVVVDSSPVLAVADGLLLAQNVDGALFSLMQDVSQTPKVSAAYQRLTMLGVPILGAVLLGTAEHDKYYGPRPPAGALS